MLVVIDLDRRIDSQFQRHGLFRAVFACDVERQHLAGLNLIGQTGDAIGFRAAQAERLRVRPLGELQRYYAHAEEVMSCGFCRFARRWPRLINLFS